MIALLEEAKGLARELNLRTLTELIERVRKAAALDRVYPAAAPFKAAGSGRRKPKDAG